MVSGISKEKDPKALGIWNAVQEVKEQYKGTPYLQPSAVYQYFQASSDVNRLKLFASENGNALKKFNERKELVHKYFLDDFTRGILPELGNNAKWSCCEFVNILYSVRC